MDRTYNSPRDVSSASQEDVARSLGRVIRGLSSRVNFIYHSDYAYAGGRRGPLLMIGALRGQWREHVRRNASATGYASGECELVEEDGGRVLLLAKDRGRGIGVAAISTLNSRLMRGTGATARFVDSPGVAAPRSTAAPAPAVGGDARTATATAESDPVALLKTLLAGFAAFKAAPTLDKLDALAARVQAWQALDGSVTDGVKGGGQVVAIDRLLREKGRAYVASKQAKPAAG